MPTNAALFSPNPHEEWWGSLAGRDAQAVLALLDTEAAGGRRQQSVYELFAEMEEKDGHLYAALQTRTNGLMGLDRALHPGGDSATDRDAAEHAREALAAFPRFGDFLRTLLDGIAKGFSVVELVWGYDARGRLVPVDWVAHPQEFFAFDARGRLMLLAPPFTPGDGRVGDGIVAEPGRTPIASQRAFAPPPRKFIALVFGRDARNPYGRGLCQRAYWFYWFKKNCLRGWSIHNERHGSPTAVATYSPGTPDEERARLLDALRALQTDMGIVVPEGVRLQFLDGGGQSEGRTFRDLADWCNDELSKIVLGATLTTGEGRRSGSLALGQVHDGVRQDYIEADARLLEEVLDATLLRWLCELNFPGGTRPPLLRIDARPVGDLEQQARIDRDLVALGVPLPLDYFYERYRRPVPATGARSLQYDDSNLYQYHLRFGVLTVNEVRARLNLSPVPWGNRPASESFDNASTAPALPTGNTIDVAGGSAREDATRGEGRERDGEGLRESEPREP